MKVELTCIHKIEIKLDKSTNRLKFVFGAKVKGS